MLIQKRISIKITVSFPLLDRARCMRPCKLFYETTGKIDELYDKKESEKVVEIAQTIKLKAVCRFNLLLDVRNRTNATYTPIGLRASLCYRHLQLRNCLETFTYLMQGSIYQPYNSK